MGSIFTTDIFPLERFIRNEKRIAYTTSPVMINDNINKTTVKSIKKEKKRRSIDYQNPTFTKYKNVSIEYSNPILSENYSFNDERTLKLKEIFDYGYLQKKRSHLLIQGRAKSLENLHKNITKLKSELLKDKMYKTEDKLINIYNEMVISSDKLDKLKYRIKESKSAKIEDEKLLKDNQNSIDAIREQLTFIDHTYNQLKEEKKIVENLKQEIDEIIMKEYPNGINNIEDDGQRNKIDEKFKEINMKLKSVSEFFKSLKNLEENKYISDINEAALDEIRLELTQIKDDHIKNQNKRNVQLLREDIIKDNNRIEKMMMILEKEIVVKKKKIEMLEEDNIRITRKLGQFDGYHAKNKNEKNKLKSEIANLEVQKTNIENKLDEIEKKIWSYYENNIITKEEFRSYMRNDELNDEYIENFKIQKVPNKRELDEIKTELVKLNNDYIKKKRAFPIFKAEQEKFIENEIRRLNEEINKVNDKYSTKKSNQQILDKFDGDNVP